jgi:lipoyl(octanoyl) transferase
MREFTDARDAHTADEIWLLEHPSVFTLGQAGRREHLLAAGDIEVVQSDRGGQVTYHGPGQVVMYTMVDLRRLGIGIRTLVQRLEEAVIDMLHGHDVAADRLRGAPGVYVAGAKVAALGLRVRNGCTYHGLALNVDVDLAPFARIDPCGYPDLVVTRLADLGVAVDIDRAGDELAACLGARLGLTLAHGAAEPGGR